MSQTLLLTSGGMKMPFIREEVRKLFTKPATEVKLALINTASKHASGEQWVIDDNNGLEELGFDIDVIDLEGKNADQLLKLLSDKDIIYVQGGEPFFLLKHVRLSGFESVVRVLLEKGVVYIGHSAGTYIACPTLEMALWHKPNRDTYGITDYTAMNLVPLIITVHYEEARKKANERGIQASRYPVKILTDQQALLFKYGNYALVGDTHEVIL